MQVNVRDKLVALALTQRRSGGGSVLLVIVQGDEKSSPYDNEDASERVHHQKLLRRSIGARYSSGRARSVPCCGGIINEHAHEEHVKPNCKYLAGACDIDTNDSISDSQP